MTCLWCGNIAASLAISLTVATAAAQKRVRLPSSGLAFSPDSSLVAFVRPTPDVRIRAGAAGPDDGKTEATEIWIARRDGSSARRLLRGRACGFRSS